MMLNRTARTARTVLLAALVCGTAHADGTVTLPGSDYLTLETIWSAESGSMVVCQGRGAMCTVPAGLYTVVNQSTGERYRITVPEDGSGLDASGGSTETPSRGDVDEQTTLDEPEGPYPDAGVDADNFCPGATVCRFQSDVDAEITGAMCGARANGQIVPHVTFIQRFLDGRSVATCATDVPADIAFTVFVS